MPELSLFSMDEFLGANGKFILLDLEFTCWENSLRDGWADPDRPPEVIEIGVAAFDAARDSVLDRFASFVRPQKNVELSIYCKDLLRISQADVSRAPLLDAVVAQVTDWTRRQGLAGTPTCAWGSNDRLFLTQDVRRAECRDPFEGRRHLDLQSLFRSTPGHPADAECDRDRVRTELGLLPNPNRHRALDDAVDLVQFCRRLRTFRA